MTWGDVLRRDLTSTYRSRTVPIVAFLHLAVTVLAVTLLTYTSRPGYPPSMRDGVFIVGSGMALLVPLVALVGTYGAIVNERTTGSIRFLLGLPNSRADAYLGKYLSRSLVVVGPLAVGSALAALVVDATFADGSVVEFLLLGGLAAVYGLVFVGIGLAVSGAASTDNRAIAGAVGVYAVLRGGWPAAQRLGLDLVGAAAYAPYPEWYFWVGRANPMNAFVKLTTVTADFEYGHPFVTTPREVTGFAVSNEYAAVVLLAWAVLPPLVGYASFKGTDLL